MQIKITIHVPEEQLKAFLEKEKETREGFITHAKESFSELHLEEDIPGTITSLEITD